MTKWQTLSRNYMEIVVDMSFFIFMFTVDEMPTGLGYNLRLQNDP